MKAVLFATCYNCGRRQTKMRSDWSLYAHNNPSNGKPCAGIDPEIMFTAILRHHNLDVRPDAAENIRYRVNVTK